MGVIILLTLSFNGRVGCVVKLHPCCDVLNNFNAFMDEFYTIYEIIKSEVWKGMQSPPSHLENSRHFILLIIFTLP